LADGSALFDHFDKNFTLLRLNDSNTDCSPLLNAAKERGVPITLFDQEEPETYDLYQAELVLIRPDEYVAWRGDSLPQDPMALVDLISGRV
jgi:hypothetical protein